MLLEWLLDACSYLNLTWEIYWCTVEILDFLILQCKCVSLANIHITGGCCLFLAVKGRYRSFWKKLSLDTLVEKVFHHKYRKNQIIEIEGKIITLIGMNGQYSKHFSTIYDQNLNSIQKLSKKAATEVFRLLVLTWINPEKALKNR